MRLIISKISANLLLKSFSALELNRVSYKVSLAFFNAASEASTPL
jgi:hypothetical protein